MKSTKIIQIIFTLLVLPILWIAQKLSNLAAESSDSSMLVLFCLFGIPVLYFVLWMSLSVRVFKKKNNLMKTEVESDVE